MSPTTLTTFNFKHVQRHQDYYIDGGDLFILVSMLPLYLLLDLVLTDGSGRQHFLLCTFILFEKRFCEI